MPRRSAPRRPARPLTAPAILLVLAGCALGISIAVALEPLPVESRVADRPIEVADDGFVSSDTCRSCHPSEYASWHGSFHRTMTQVATPETVRADFDGVVVTETAGAPMRLERRQGEFWAEFDDPGWEGPPAERPRITRRVVMITGSHQQNIYWYSTGHDRALNVLPAVYLLDEARWVPRSAVVLHPPGQGRRDDGWPLERDLHRLPHDPRPDRLRHAVRVSSCRRAVGGHHGGRTRHRLRVVSRARRVARAHQPEPAAPVRPLRPRRRRRRRRRRSDHRAARTARSGARSRGLRSVSRHLDVPRRRGRAGRQHARSPLPSRGHAARNPLRGPTEGQRQLRPHARAARGGSGFRPRVVLGRRTGARVGPRVQRTDRLALLPRRHGSRAHDDLPLVPCDAPRRRTTSVPWTSGRTRTRWQRAGTTTADASDATRRSAPMSPPIRSTVPDRREAAATTATCRTPRTASCGPSAAIR